MKFKLQAPFSPTGDQPEAIKKLIEGVRGGMKEQVLLGTTGSGKTFTMASVVEAVGRPTLVISHNKTLAGQLYQEFRDFFPKNAVSYFVSYYDYYQPEAYVPTTDTYIAKETEINELIDKLRLEATNNILTRSDVLVVASVSCLYNLGSPQVFRRHILTLRKGDRLPREEILRQLVEIGYQRQDYELRRAGFRVRGENLDIFPSSGDYLIRLIQPNEVINTIECIDPLTGKRIKDLSLQYNEEVKIPPARHYLAGKNDEEIFSQIRKDLEERVKFFKEKKRFIEAQRIAERVNYDLEMIKRVGYVNGIENYSRYFDNRAPGEPPYTLLDYFKEAYGQDWLLFIDESHMSIPQIRGMYRGDYERKKTLVDFGFRLPAAFDNRPLRFEEFLRRTPQTIYVSATPADWELSRAKDGGQVVEQLIRPTGLLDPEVIIRPTANQVQDLIGEIKKKVAKNQRVLVLTLTKRLAEDLTDFLKKENLRVAYLHSEIETLKRSDVLDNLRLGTVDVLVGINLLREGLDLPEVSLVAILDADKEGFLRSKTSLIQIMGRAARHEEGQVILYADTLTGSIKEAVAEVNRRRAIQEDYNRRHGIIPHSIKKPVRSKLIVGEEEEKKEEALNRRLREVKSLLPNERRKLVADLRREMKKAADELDFEQAIKIRDEIARIGKL